MKPAFSNNPCKRFFSYKREMCLKTLICSRALSQTTHKSHSLSPPAFTVRFWSRKKLGYSRHLKNRKSTRFAKRLLNFNKIGKKTHLNSVRRFALYFSI